jgi:hypothetical protein
METDRFDRLVHALAVTSRRSLGRRLAAGVLAAAGLADRGALAPPAAAAKKKKPKPCKPKCPVCRRCRRGRCAPVADGTPCGEGQTCEDGACPPPPPPLVCGAGGPCRVFMTSLPASGYSYNGLAGADEFCRTFAEGAGLSGTYLAWLSAGADSPTTRFTNRAAAGPYRLVPNPTDNGNPPPTVADSFADLTTCDVNGGAGACLKHPINRFATGVAFDNPAFVWTGTTSDGTVAADTCNGWALAEDGELLGEAGIASAATADWTQLGLGDCDVPGYLYCFEQAIGNGA